MAETAVFQVTRALYRHACGNASLTCRHKRLEEALDGVANLAGRHHPKGLGVSMEPVCKTCSTVRDPPFSEAAVLFLARNPDGKKIMARLERKHPKRKALAVLSHKLGRTVWYLLARGKPFDPQRFNATA